MYTLTVKYFRMDNYNEFTFKQDLFGEFSAGYLAQKYDGCSDVFSVELVSNDTGEILFAHNKRDGYYWNVLGVE